MWSFVSKVMSLLFNTLSRLIIAFLPRSKCLLISWLQSLSAVTFGAQENKVCHCFHFFPICHEVMWLDTMILSFLNVEILASFFFTLFFSPSSRGSLVLLCFLPLGWCHLRIWGYWYFFQKSWFQLVLHPAWHLAWCMYPAYKWNKQGDNIQPWCVPSPTWTSLLFHVRF